MGELIEFYYPAAKLLTKEDLVEKKPANFGPPPVPKDAVTRILDTLVKSKQDIRDMVVCLVDNEGVAGLVGTLGGYGETLLFLKRFEQSIVHNSLNTNVPEST